MGCYFYLFFFVILYFIFIVIIRPLTELPYIYIAYHAHYSDYTQIAHLVPPACCRCELPLVVPRPYSFRPTLSLLADYAFLATDGLFSCTLNIHTLSSSLPTATPYTS